MPLKLTLPEPVKPKPTSVALINDIARLFHEKMKKAAGEHHFKDAYRVILQAVGQHRGLNQLQIAAEAHLAPPTVSIIMQKMEKEGLIRREVDPKDLRQMLVYLTDKGREVNHILCTTAEGIDEMIMDGLTPQERELLYPILEKMHKNISSKKKRS